ncbi:hypothetical protein COU60_05530 [Candidatus Pacearchaeota archaeon CG10_big_fil_rev_8_21_14_0_10_34_76]|nr:MAG: hypothetical protein COU60_05530 [Candidatus Pacearchaeota archaeon CG10_big_fil_rev_8_21_14_0_10_34_76]
MKKSVSKKTVKKPLKKSSKKKIEKCIRVKTGIPNFDSLMEGGFEKNSTNLVVGGPGSGKTILSTQFILEGIKNNEHCLYLTFEEKKEQFYHNMRRFGWDLEEYEKKGLFTFLEYTPIKIRTMLEEGGGEVEHIIVKNKVKRIVIDSITSFALLFDDELKKREAALELFNMIKKWDCTSLLTYEGKPSRDEKMTSRTLEFESDSIIILHFIRKLVKRERFIEILKMRGTDHSKGVHKFQLGKSGIQVDKNPERVNV